MIKIDGPKNAEVGRRDLTSALGVLLGTLAMGACSQPLRPEDEKHGSSATALSGSAFLWADTIADLRTIIGSDTSSTSQPVAVVGGYRAVGDGGGGIFYWDSSSSSGDNGGTIFVPTGSSSGRWVRLYSGDINVKWFGAYGDGTHEDSSFINAAIAFVEAQPAASSKSGNTVYLPPGNYKVTAPSATAAAITIVNNNVSLVGAGGPPRGGTQITVWGTGGGGTGLLIERAGGAGSNAEVADYSQLHNLSIVGGPTLPRDLVVVHAESVVIAHCYFYGCTRFGLLIESGTGPLGATQLPAGTYLSANFWRIFSCYFVTCGNRVTGAGDPWTDGAAILVHGSDSNGGCAVGVQAANTNVSFADWSLGGGTWVACYSQEAVIGYASSTNSTTWVGCNTEDVRAASFQSSANAVAVGGSLSASGEAPNRLGDRGSVYARAVRSDGSIDPVLFHTNGWGATDAYGAWTAVNFAVTPAMHSSITFRRTSSGMPPLTGANGERDNGWWGFRTAQNSDLIDFSNYPLLLSDAATSVGYGWAWFPKGYFLGDGLYVARARHSISNVPPVSPGSVGDIIYNSNPSAGGNVGWIYTRDGGWKTFGVIAS